jgi:hypothetical protein
MKITHKEYESALEIVKKYRQQIVKELSFIEKPLVEVKAKKQLIDVETGDFITPIKTNKTNAHCWTIGRKYKVLEVVKRYSSGSMLEEYIVFRKLIVKNDNGKLNVVRLFNGVKYDWRKDDYISKPNYKWKCV